jgi:hypothetical protein
MTITYPLSLPTSIGIASITFSAENAVAISSSPFTYSQQIVQHPGQRWSASISLPPLRRDLMESWVAFLLSLKGQYGTFLLGDPNCATPRGSAGVTPGTPVVKGGSQTGDELDIDGLPLSATGYLLAGDYIQLGTGSSSTLHKVLKDVNSNGSGEATLDLWPSIRTAPADNAAVVVSSAKGKFRLANNVQQWEINNMSNYGITFDCVEAI